MRFATEFTATVVSSSTEDDGLGNTTVTQTETPVERVLYAPRSSSERADNRAPAVLTAASLYFLEGLPDGVLLDSDDAIRISGVHPLVDGTYQVEGIPGVWGDMGVEVAVSRASAV